MNFVSETENHLCFEWRRRWCHTGDSRRWCHTGDSRVVTVEMDADRDSDVCRPEPEQVSQTYYNIQSVTFLYSPQMFGIIRHFWFRSGSDASGDPTHDLYFGGFKMRKVKHDFRTSCWRFHRPAVLLQVHRCKRSFNDKLNRILKQNSLLSLLLNPSEYDSYQPWF